MEIRNMETIENVIHFFTTWSPKKDNYRIDPVSVDAACMPKEEKVEKLPKVMTQSRGNFVNRERK